MELEIKGFYNGYSGSGWKLGGSIRGYWTMFHSVLY